MSRDNHDWYAALWLFVIASSEMADENHQYLSTTAVRREFSSYLGLRSRDEVLTFSRLS